jgi:phage terminase large subunit
MAKLDALTGVNKLRTRYGFWSSPSGMCLPSYDRNVHVIAPFQVPYEWPQWWSIDFGKVHPFSWGQWAVDPNDRAYLIREIYMTGREVEDHCRQILQITRHDPRPTEIITDHQAQERMICDRMFGRETKLADKSVLEGIDYLDKRLAQRRLFIFENSLVEVDQSLASKGLPTRFSAEIPGYVWAKGKRSAEGPVKRWDDACDMARYFVMEQDAPEQWEVGWE